MKVLSFFLLLLSVDSFGQERGLTPEKLQAYKVKISSTDLNGNQAMRVVKDTSIKAVDQPTFAKITGSDFSNGTIEVMVLSRLLSTASASDRGFIGIAFRINEDNTKFENIYIRPTNGRAEIQLRRNRSIQYFSYPDYSYERFRKENPGEYESYADMGLDEWIKLKIVVKGQQAKLFLNDNTQPSLIVNDLKHGAHARGDIGLWVDVGTEGFFRNLQILKK